MTGRTLCAQVERRKGAAGAARLALAARGGDAASLSGPLARPCRNRAEANQFMADARFRHDRAHEKRGG